LREENEQLIRPLNNTRRVMNVNYPTIYQPQSFIYSINCWISHLQF